MTKRKMQYHHCRHHNPRGIPIMVSQTSRTVNLIRQVTKIAIGSAAQRDGTKYGHLRASRNKANVDGFISS